MASEITDQDPAGSPSNQDDLGNGENRGIKRQRTSTAAADDDDDDDDKPGRERRKIEIKFIQDKSRRHITFSKRKAGIMKKVSFHIVVATRRVKSMRQHANKTTIGLRTLCTYWYSSATTRCLRDWSGLHFHNTQAPAARDQARGQEPHSGKTIVSTRQSRAQLLTGSPGLPERARTSRR